MGREFQPKLAPLSKPAPEKALSLTTLLIKSLLAQRYKFFITAGLQLGISTVFPGRYAVVPIATLALLILTTQAIDLLTPSPSPPPAFMRSVVPGRTSSLLPRPDGSFGSSPSSQPLVVFKLGVQFNHPRGQFCPGGKEIAEKFLDMNRSLLERRDELGLISVSSWGGQQEEIGSTILLNYYFRDVESVHKFAHEEMHRKAWDWYTNERLDHIGIFHETFLVPAHAYESIYVNCKPLLMGAGLVRCEGLEKEGAQWRNTLVSADTMGLKSQWQRMNRDMNGLPKA
ncbi:hypothetical protein QQS21_004354 [Conoideocrella luteorostrata]|uniref:Monooxygenase n=1 Tax=Conoideocrella luteorostrata TaxID=1105319 RepID=A0AAJ0CRK1_9HYPO|nr:hypothetical protein QQS21_004354 [Conoideocrella luteorostrata]